MSNTTSNSGTSDSNNPLDTLWYTRCTVPTPLGLAAQLGWFTQEFARDGIQIKTLQEVTDPAVTESHFDHHLNNSFRQGGNVPPIWAKANGRDTRVIGLNWVDEYQGVISLPRSGIHAPKDLRGRRIGLPVAPDSIDHRRAAALRGVLAALDLGEIARHEVEWVDVAINSSDRSGPYAEFTHVVEALLRGDVDAVYVKGARGLEATQRAGAHVVTDINHHPDPLVRANNSAPRPITVDSFLLRTRPDLVARFLARIVAIGDWAAVHPDEVFAYVSKETRSDQQWVRAAYGEDLHLHQRTDLDESSIAGLEAYTKFLFDEGFIAQNFNVREWIDPRPVAQIQNFESKKSA